MEMNGRSSVSYLVHTPRVLFLLFILQMLIGLEAKGLLAFQGRRGIVSIVQWNLLPVIFGVVIIHYPSENQKGTAGRGRQKENHDNINKRHDNLRHISDNLLLPSLPKALKLPGSSPTSGNPPPCLNPYEELAACLPGSPDIHQTHCQLQSVRALPGRRRRRQRPKKAQNPGRESRERASHPSRTLPPAYLAWPFRRTVKTPKEDLNHMDAGMKSTK